MFSFCSENKDKDVEEDMIQNTFDTLCISVDSQNYTSVFLCIYMYIIFIYLLNCFTCLFGVCFFFIN